MSYRERSGEREPDLKDLSKFITAQSQIENEPVYGRKSESQTKFSVGRNPNKKALEERAGPTIPTLVTKVRTQENGGNQGTKKPVTASEQGSNGGINTVTQRDQNLELCKVKFQISSASRGIPSFPVYHALTVKSLNVSDRYCPSQLDLSPWPHLSGLQLPNTAVDVNEVSVLTGQHVPQVHLVLDYCWGDSPQSQPYGMKTPFGWCVAGPTNGKEDENKPVVLSVFEFDWAEDKRDMKLHEQVERFWALESLGFRSDGTSNSLEDERALEILKRTTKLKDGRYELGLLWRNDNPELPNNRVQAEKRLQQLKRRFQRSPKFAAHYKTVMNDYIDKGYAVKLSEEEAARTSIHPWYLPHHGVINPNKSKVRVVYDAAARFEGTALNKELLQGQLLNNTLVAVFMRFRKDEVAVASDA